MSSERDKMLDMITEMSNWNYKKDKIIEDLQSQLDQANEMIKLMYRDLLETGEWQKSMAVYRKEAERKLQELRGGK